MSQKFLIVFGTRPEAIKMVPVVKALRARPGSEVQVCVTAQHREMLDQVLDLFGVEPDYDLDIMTRAQGLEQLTVTAIEGISNVIKDVRPTRVLVHGDTTTTMAAAIAAFYQKVPVAHVEAGLRSGNPLEPWPEEINRKVVDVIADQFFAPTEHALENLLRENVQPERVFISGNTVIDALLSTVEIIRSNDALESQLSQRFPFLTAGRRTVLATAHRRENFGAAFENICHAISEIARQDRVQVVFPAHPNPNVQGPARRLLTDQPNVHLIDPLDYLPFVYLMMRSDLIVTDSGGIQEEAPSLGKPVFVLRNVTERPEAVAAGTVKLVGTNRQRIVESVLHILNDQSAYERMSRAHNPYGDGKAAEKIADVVTARSRQPREPAFTAYQPQPAE